MNPHIRQGMSVFLPCSFNVSKGHDVPWRKGMTNDASYSGATRRMCNIKTGDCGLVQHWAARRNETMLPLKSYISKLHLRNKTHLPFVFTSWECIHSCFINTASRTLTLSSKLNFFVLFTLVAEDSSCQVKSVTTETEHFIVWSYKREDMLVGSSCENPRLVTEIQPPAQQAAPVRVPVVVVVHDPREAQRHIAEKRRVLHHVGISCRDWWREVRDHNCSVDKTLDRTAHSGERGIKSCCYGYPLAPNEEKDEIKSGWQTNLSEVMETGSAGEWHILDAATEKKRLVKVEQKKEV